MTTEQQKTREEEAFWQLCNEKWEMLSEAALGVLRKADYAADGWAHIDFHVGPEEHREILQEMCLAADELTGWDFKLLAEISRAALAAASINLEGYAPSLLGYGSRNGDWEYYQVMSVTLGQFLEETAEGNSEALSDTQS